MPLTRLLKLSLVSGPIVATLSAALIAIVVLALAPDHSTPVGATGDPFPNLIVEDIIPRNQFGGDCTVPAGVDVVVKNIGKRNRQTIRANCHGPSYSAGRGSPAAR